MNIILAINFIIMGGSVVYLHRISKKTKPEVRTKYIRLGWITIVVGIGMLAFALLS